MKQIILSLLLLSFSNYLSGQATISGHVWNDANGLTDLEINNSGGSFSITNNINVYLVDTSTNLILQAYHSTANSYAFYNVPENTAYNLVMSWAVANQGDICPSVTLPPGWIVVGENIGAGIFSYHDGTPNGKLLLEVLSDDIADCNFGIKQY